MKQTFQNQTPYEQQQCTEIDKWKSTEPNVVNQAIATLLKPLTWVVANVVPDKAIEGAITAAYKAAEFLTDKDDIIRDAQITEISELKHKDLELSDRLANEVHNWAIGVAGAEGAATGAAGLPGMAVDIPALITMSFRVIHKIGICYGYEATTEADKNYILQIFSAAGSNTMQEKQAAILILRQATQAIAKTTWKGMAQKAANNKFCVEGGILAVKAVAKQFGINITRRKALQTIPDLGALIGGSMNLSLVNDIAWAARRMYQERWLIDNNKIVVVED